MVGGPRGVVERILGEVNNGIIRAEIDLLLPAGGQIDCDGEFLLSYRTKPLWCVDEGMLQTTDPEMCRYGFAVRRIVRLGGIGCERFQVGTKG